MNLTCNDISNSNDNRTRIIIILMHGKWPRPNAWRPRGGRRRFPRDFPAEIGRSFRKRRRGRAVPSLSGPGSDPRKRFRFSPRDFRGRIHQWGRASRAVTNDSRRKSLAVRRSSPSTDLSPFIVFSLNFIARPHSR